MKKSYSNRCDANTILFRMTIGIIAAVLTTAAFIPQAFKTIRTREVKDLSLATFSMIFAGTICWCIYGGIIGDVPLIYASGLTAFLSGIIVFMKVASMIRE